MNLKQFLTEPSTAVMMLALLVIAQWYWSSSSSDLNSKQARSTSTSLSTEVQLERVRDAAVDVNRHLESLNLDNELLEQQIAGLLAVNQFKIARTQLLEIAAEAVNSENHRQLGNVLLLLGSVAIDSQELNSAELLLQEALEIASRQNDKVTMAKTYQQLGRLNIKARALARYAAEAYDRLWLARSQMFRGDYRNAEENLNKVIAVSTEIRRYGAAADALETLAAFHLRFHDNYQAHLADAEAARLYATSGQLSRARTIADRLANAGYEPSELEFLRQEIDSLFRQHEKDQMQVAQAQDLKMLYHHYRSQGDYKRAWELRIKASRLLGETSETAVFERGADVLAILYNSNFAMDRAMSYLSSADSLFSSFGASDEASVAQSMQSLIY